MVKRINRNFRPVILNGPLMEIDKVFRYRRELFLTAIRKTSKGCNFWRNIINAIKGSVTYARNTPLKRLDYCF